NGLLERRDGCSTFLQERFKLWAAPFGNFNAVDIVEEARFDRRPEIRCAATEHDFAAQLRNRLGKSIDNLRPFDDLALIQPVEEDHQAGLVGTLEFAPAFEMLS